MKRRAEHRNERGQQLRGIYAFPGDAVKLFPVLFLTLGDHQVTTSSAYGAMVAAAKNKLHQNEKT